MSDFSKKLTREKSLFLRHLKLQMFCKKVVNYYKITKANINEILEAHFFILFLLLIYFYVIYEHKIEVNLIIFIKYYLTQLYLFNRRIFSQNDTKVIRPI